MRTSFLTIVLTLWALNVFAAEVPLTMEKAFQFSVERHGPQTIRLHWRIAQGYYLYRRYLSAQTRGGEPVGLRTRPGQEKADPNFGKTEVYFDSADADIADIGSPFVVAYQGCQEHGLCYPPTKRTIDPVTLRVTDEPLFTPPVAEQSRWAEQAPTDTANRPQIADSTKTPASSTGDDLVERLLGHGGVPVVLAAFLGFGILLAFTPCVFPLYPILAATLTREGEQLTAFTGFLLSLSYAFGLAAAFGIFGAAAGWTGENLQIALQSRITIGIIAAIFALLALSMFGLYELQLPSLLVSRLSRSGGTGRGSLTGAGVLGFSSAFIIGPCVTAPLAGALLYVARTGDALLGGALLFALGLGKGVPLIVFGTAGSGALPKAGAWMEAVKQLFGFIFIAFSIWIAVPLLPNWLPIVLWAIWAMACAIFLGAFDFAADRSSPLRIASRALGMVSAVYAMVLTVGLAAGSTDPLHPLGGFGTAKNIAASLGVQPSSVATVASNQELARELDQARSAGKPSLVYFTAGWCVSCRIIDRDVLSRQDVVSALKQMKVVKVDLTDNSSAGRQLMRELDVVGPPTMVLFHPDRSEVRPRRLVGEFGAEDVLKAIESARAGS